MVPYRQMTHDCAGKEDAQTLALGVAERRRDEGRLTEAAALYRAYLADKPGDAVALSGLGFCLWGSGDLDGAIATYEQAICRNPESAGNHLCLGLVLRQKNDDARALVEFQAAINLAPGFARAHGALADLLWARRNYDGAVMHYRRAIEYQPDWVEAHESLSRVLTWQERLPEAEMFARRAVQLAPRRPSAYGALAMILSRRDEHGEAEKILGMALAMQPNDAALWSQFGWQLWRAQKWAEAEAVAKAALARDPTLAYPYCLLGRIATKRGEHATAAEWYRRYLELDPADSEGVTYLLAHLGDTPDAARAPDGYLKMVYARRALYWDAEGTKSYRGHTLLHETLMSVVGDAGDLDVIDAGCGTGLSGPLVRPMARTLDGVDLSAQMLGRAQDRGIYDDLIEGDLEAVLRARPQRYDLVISAATLIHFGDLGSPFAAAAAALRPSGWFAFTVFPFEGAGFRLLPFNCYGHSQEHIQDRAHAAGFEVAAMHDGTHEYHGGKAVTGLAVVLRRRA